MLLRSLLHAFDSQFVVFRPALCSAVVIYKITCFLLPLEKEEKINVFSSLIYEVKEEKINLFFWLLLLDSGWTEQHKTWQKRLIWHWYWSYKQKLWIKLQIAIHIVVPYFPCFLLEPRPRLRPRVKQKRGEKVLLYAHAIYIYYQATTGQTSIFAK